MKDPDQECIKGHCPCKTRLIHPNGTLVFSMDHLRRRTDLNCHFENGKTLLLTSLFNEDNILLDALLDNKCLDVNMLDMAGEPYSDLKYYKVGSALHKAIYEMKLVAVKKLLRRQFVFGMYNFLIFVQRIYFFQD